MERLDKIKGHLAHIIVMMSRRTGLDTQRIEADINEQALAGDWKAGFPYWAPHESLPFIPYNGLKELTEQEQTRLYAGFCNIAGGLLASLAVAVQRGDLDAAMPWAEEQVIELAWLGGTIDSVWAEKGRAQQTGAMTGAKKASPLDVLQRTHDLYWENMRDMRHDLNARTKTGIQIAELEGKSKPLSARAVADRLAKHKERTKT